VFLGVGDDEAAAIADAKAEATTKYGEDLPPYQLTVSTCSKNLTTGEPVRWIVELTFDRPPQPPSDGTG
jgi:hypothetical protein